MLYYFFCADYDECSNESHNCHENATCINAAGYFECICNPGFTGDGRICAGKIAFFLIFMLLLFLVLLCLLLRFVLFKEGD